MDPIDQAYAAPRSVVTTPEARQRPSPAWRLHFALVALAALALWGLAVDHVLTDASPLPLRALAFTFPLVLTWGAAGLYGFIHAQRVGPRWLWMVYLALIWLLTLVTGGLQALAVYGGLNIGLPIGVWLVPDLTKLMGTLAIAVPLIFALGRYVSHYPRLLVRR